MTVAAYESVLFGLPPDPELFLAALTAVQDYVNVQLVRMRGSEAQNVFVAVYSPNRQLDFLIPTIGKPHPERMKELEISCYPRDVARVEEWEPQRGEWDLAYAFDGSAYKVSAPTMKTAALTFSLLIGAAPVEEYPDLSGLGLLNTVTTNVLLLPFEGRDEIQELIELNRPDLVVRQFGTEEVVLGNPEYDLLQAVSSDMVIGPRSFLTYAATAFGRRVVELYSSDMHPQWLSKWASPGYQMVYGDHFPVEFIWRAVEEVISRWQMTLIK